MRLLISCLLCSLPCLAADPEVVFDLKSPPVVLPEDHPDRGKAPPLASIKLDAENASFTWTDEKLRKRAYQLDLIANHSGPRPWSEHLAWLVARAKDDFWILWVYVNEQGTGCWINSYHFAENRIRMSLFRGKYVYRPPETFATSPFEIDVPLDRAPAYKGKKFKHPDFGPEGGRFRKLRYLDGAEWRDREEELAVRPLIDLDVPGNNGWANHPWTEVHGLARSPDGTRLYYVVTYTAVNHGWVVDLKDGRVLKTHFGEPVKLEPGDPK
jgi:hypothetical protein